MSDPEYIQVGAVGPHAVMVRKETRLSPRELVIGGLGLSVNADGANGITKGTAWLARKLGVHVAPGADRIPLAAYHPDDIGNPRTWMPPGRGPLGLDAPESGMPKGGTLANGYGWLVLDGMPYIQGPSDPYPGALLSTTALQDTRYPETDPRRYVDSVSVPGFVLPHNDLRPWGVQLGDLALVTYDGVSVWVQATDSGNSGHLLEVSIATCLALGLPACARKGSGVDSGASIRIFPGSGNVLDWHPATPQQITESGPWALRQVGLEN